MASNDRNRLTQAQKKMNHIESERKRREAIRRSFDALSEVVPGMEGHARSEAVMLQNTVAYIEELSKRKEELRRLVAHKGIDNKKFETIYDRAFEASTSKSQTSASSPSSPSSSELALHEEIKNSAKRDRENAKKQREADNNNNKGGKDGGKDKGKTPLFFHPKSSSQAYYGHRDSRA